MFYWRVFLTFFRNSLIREAMFRGNFVIQVLTRLFWFSAQIALFKIIYSQVTTIREWTEHQYFAFMATGMLVNSIVEAFFMPNCAEFSENIRTGRLDFALTKPIDTQFLISLERVNISMVSQLLLSIALLVRSLWMIGSPISTFQVLGYLFYVIVAVMFFYSLMITTACTSILFGRNQGLYDFWFYITVFARYPRSIYDGRTAGTVETGEVIQFAFSYIVPILIVITVPSQVILGTLADWRLAVAAMIASTAGLLVARTVFHWSLNHYRSASS
ncbi:MAG: ABC-2 family transporter protein [Planctomyces sp.]|nr:ABC-2 family transporter protein [Planctomyces sp.]